MYKVINIGGEDYKLEFTIEASLYNDCIERVVSLMYGIDEGGANQNFRQVLSELSDVPNTAMSCFYAGLLEHHGKTGDGSVPNIQTAKRLATELIRDENSEVKNWYDLLTLCIDQMGEDGFFDLIGLTALLNSDIPNTPKRAKKTPQDHKPKNKPSAN